MAIFTKLRNGQFPKKNGQASRPFWRMKHKVPSTSNEIPADLKGASGSGLAIMNAEELPIFLSPGLKGEVQRIINQYAANKTALTPIEFVKFLKEVQQVVPYTVN